MYRMVRVLLAVVVAVFFVAEVDGRQERDGLRLRLKADRMSYVLGEPVNLEISVLNASPTPAPIPDGTDVWEGHLEVLIASEEVIQSQDVIASEDGRYKEYRGPGWGLRDVAGSGSITLRPGQAHATQATILYNHGVDTDHLNARRAKEILERYLATGYALGTPGRYRIKARLYGHRFVNSIESAPIAITVSAPTGVDREVWEVLKTDPEYGYFIQSGGPKGHPTAPRSVRILETLEKIANEQPQSRYTEAIQRSLSKHREVLEDLRGRGLVAY